MMTVQANPSRALLSISSRGPSRRQSHAPCVVSVSINRSPRVASAHATPASVSLPYAPLLNHQRSKSRSRYLANTVSCMLGGKDFSEDANKGFPWNPVGKPMENSRGKSIEDVLREQMAKKEYYDGGSGKKPPRFGFFRFGFGFGGNRGDGSGWSEDRSRGDVLHEFVQLVAAGLCFLVMYVFFLSGPEIMLLCNDFIKYLSGRRPSVRLKKEMNNWGRFYQGLTRRLNPNKHWLEVAILNMTSLFISPVKYWIRGPEKYLESGESEFKKRSMFGLADNEDDRTVSYDDSDDEN